MLEDLLRDDSPEPSTLPDSGKELKLRKPICPYVCATPIDFEEELTFLAEKVYPRLVEFSLQRGAYFSPVDIRWKPEDGIIQNGQLLRLLLDYIHKCAPFFICLLGECYGPFRAEGSPTLPKRFRDIPENCPALDRNYLVAASAGYEWVLAESHQNCSLTELEIFQAAFLGDSEHCNFYFRQAEHLEHKFEGLSENEREAACERFKEESEHAGLKIWDLKQRIVKKGLPVKYFKTPEELGTLVYSDWTAVVDLLYPPLEDLDHFIGTEEYSEWMSQESFAENLRQRFIANTTSDTIMDSLTDFTVGLLEEKGMESDIDNYPKYRTYSASSFFRKKPEEPIKKKSMLILTGERGSGKSAIISKWLKNFREDYPNVKAIHHFVGCSAHSRDIAMFLQRCIHQLREHFLFQDEWDDIEEKSAPSNEDQPTNFRETCEAFVAAASLGPCVLVLDGIDELGGSHGLTPQEVKEFDWLPLSLPHNCNLIMTTNKSDLTFCSLSKRRDVQLLSVPSISSDRHKVELLKDSMQQHFSHLNKNCLQQILDMKLSSKPLFLQVLSAELQCYSVYQDLEGYVEECLEVTSVREFWTRCLQRWTLEYSWQIDTESEKDSDEKKDFEYVGWVCDALILLALSRNGLSRIEIMELLRIMGYTDELEVSQYDWLQFRSCLGSAVYDKADGLIDFSHGHLKEIVEYVVLRIIKTSISDAFGGSGIETEWTEKKRKLHGHLADYFKEQPYSQRKLHELPWQLMMAGDHEALLGFVTHIDYLLDLLDESGRFPGNKYDLRTYWKFLHQRCGIDVSNTYQHLLVQIGLLESDLKHLKPVMLTEVPEDMSEDGVSVGVSDPRGMTSTPRTPRTPVLRYQDQLSVIEEGHSETEDRTSVQSSEYHQDHRLHISDKGLVTTLAWHISQLLLELGHSHTVQRILIGLIHYLSRNYPLSCQEMLVISESQETLGNLLHAQGDVRHAESCYRRALRNIIDLLEKNQQDLELDTTRLYVLKGRLLGHHGSLRLSEGELDEAEELLKESLETIGECSGHVTLRATILYHFGVLRHKQQDFVRSESCLRQSLLIREQWFGKSHPLVADVLVGLARLLSTSSYHKGCDKIQAEHLFKRAIKIREQCLPSNHLLTAEILYELGCLVAEQSCYSAKMESIKLLRKSLDIRTTRLGGDHADTRAAQQYLTSQEVMLRMGQYEFGPAKPTDTRTTTNPCSNLSFRDKDLSVIKKKLRSANKNRLRSVDNESSTSACREEIMRHNRPLSIMGSSASVTSASERLLQEPERPTLMKRRTSMERRYQQALDHGKTQPLCETSPSSVTSDSSIRRLTVDLSFAGGAGEDAGNPQGSRAVEGAEPLIESYASQMVPMPQMSKKTPVKFKIDCRPLSAPLRLFNRYGSPDRSKSRLSRIPSASQNRGEYAGSYMIRASSPFTNCSLQSHKSRCTVPGPHTIHISNSRSIHGPNSSIQSLLDSPGIPRDMKRAVHHKAAWYHVKGRYPTSEEPVPSKRAQSRPNSVLKTSREQSKRSEGDKEQSVLSKSSVARDIMTKPPETQPEEPRQSPDIRQQQREIINRQLALNNAIVSFKPNVVIVG